MSDTPIITPAALKAWRETYGFTQPDLADVLGVHYRTVQEWESETSTKRPPAYLTLALERIAERADP